LTNYEIKQKKNKIIVIILGSGSGVDDDSSLLECYAMSAGKELLS
jgi:hypothetical protein